MAFVSNAARNNNNQSNGNGAREFEPAAGFINYYLKGKGDSRIKVGAMPLRSSVAREANLVKWLSKPENLTKFVENLQVEYQVNDGGAGFELPE